MPPAPKSRIIASNGIRPAASACTRSGSGGVMRTRSCWRRGLLARSSGKPHWMSPWPWNTTARACAQTNSTCQPAISQWNVQRGRASTAAFAASTGLRASTRRPPRASTCSSRLSKTKLGKNAVTVTRSCLALSSTRAISVAERDMRPLWVRSTVLTP